MLDKVLTTIFGSKHDKDEKRLRPYAAEINEYFDEYESLTDEEIKAKTEEFRLIIRDNTRELEDEKAALLQKFRNEVLDAAETADIKDRLKKLDKEIHKATEEVLNEIMTQAYAVVKQACRRLKDSMHR